MPTPSPPAAFVRKVGERVRALREEAGMTADELAMEAKISPPTLSKIERGRHGASLSTLHALARALRVLPMDLLAIQATHPRVKILDAARRDPGSIRAAMRAFKKSRGNSAT